MKLVFKFTLVLLATLLPILGVRAYLTCKSEIALIEDDMLRDHLTVGSALQAFLTTLPRSVDETEAFHLITQAVHRRSDMNVRWIWLDAVPDDPNYSPMPQAQRAAVRGGETTTWLSEQGETPTLFTFFPSTVDGDRFGAVEVSESLEFEYTKARTIIERTLVVTLVIAVVFGIVTLGFGAWFVGRPVRALIEKARRTGSGDFSGRLELRQRDELSELAAELNVMADRLADAQKDLRDEAEARIATLEQLRHADRLATVGKLASGVAHELGTPLNVALVRARLIVSSSDAPEDVRENARIIASQTEHMTRIIRQLLDFARPRISRKTPVDSRALIRQAQELLSAIAQKKGVRVETEDAALPLLVDVDSGQIQQVLSNLVLNGIQAMPRGGSVRLAVRRETTRPPPEFGGNQGDYVRISVADEGEGVPQEIQNHLFEPFFTTKPVGEGTGLGLSVALGIAREHGGWISLESKIGAGSCFSLYLPIKGEKCAEES